MTKTGSLITMNRKHVEAPLSTTEQYLRDQLSKDRKTDTLENILNGLSNNLNKSKTTPMLK